MLCGLNLIICISKQVETMMDFSDDLSKDDEDLETLKILNEQMEKETPKTKIPIPETARKSKTKWSGNWKRYP